MFASDAHDFTEAERVYRVFLVSYPDDFAPHFYIARPLLMLGRPDEAVRMMERAVLLDPSSFAAIVQLARLRLRLGHFQEVRAATDKLRTMGQADWADSILVHLDFLEGKAESALKRAESLERAEEPQVRLRAPALQAAVLAEIGRTSGAISRLERSLTEPLDVSTRADRWLAIAGLRLASGDRRGAQSASMLAINQDRSPVRLARAAAVLARSGNPDEAQRLLELLPANSPSRRVQADRSEVHAEILLARRRPADAWRVFQEAARLEPPGVYLEYTARAAEAAGLRGVATGLYERMAADPEYFWRYREEVTPGEWSSAVANYSRLAWTERRGTADASIAERYRALTYREIPRTTPEGEKR
jgi:tetratricopeptide (TPR) repeat protein